MLDTSLDISAYIHGFRLSIPEVRDRNNASAGAWCLRPGGSIHIPRDRAALALEQASRFCVDPRWLIHLPPTMSPCDCPPSGPLERVDEALDYYRSAGVAKVVLEQKHMGSRAICIVCRDQETAAQRFGVSSGDGCIYTRMGRPFFPPAHEAQVLEKLRADLDHLWSILHTSWVALDCEIMPWNLKAQGLIERQYAATSCAGTLASASAAIAACECLTNRVGEMAPEPLSAVEALASRCKTRMLNAGALRAAYRPYCSSDQMRVAPFHLLAWEGHTAADWSHEQHMLCLGIALPTNASAGAWCLRHEFTPWWPISLDSPNALEHAQHAFEMATSNGGEGLVVKPFDYAPPNVQPALKVRGSEYLRLIYGPDYTVPENLERLRKRKTGYKRSLALQEFNLGLEGLRAFVSGRPLAEVHAYALAVLALECDDQGDPRL
ncbi:MAG TPA: hypothetical protein VJA25_10715 [Dehalococcoidia bacterium]|nr:hypothetical protein [Dehalococcoidia bacterium]